MTEPQNHHEIILNLMNHHLPGLVLYARNLVAESAEDVVQEAFSRLIQESPFPDAPKAWLYHVTRNLALDQLRRENRRKKNVEIMQWFEPTDETAIQPNETTEALEKLDPETREIIMSKIWGNLTFREIAELTGKPISTIHHHYQEGLKQLRFLLEEE